MKISERYVIAFSVSSNFCPYYIWQYLRKFQKFEYISEKLVLVFSIFLIWRAMWLLKESSLLNSFEYIYPSSQEEVVRIIGL